MEAILAVVAFFAVSIIYGLVVHFAKAGLTAAGRTLTGSGSFKDNMNLSLGTAAFEVRLRDVPLNDQPGSPLVKEIEVKGLFPISGKYDVRFVTSVLDVTEKPAQSVLSLLETFQEHDTVAYQHVVEVGQIQESFGFVSWVRVGVVIPEILQPPVSGERKLAVIIRMVDTTSPPAIEGGFHEGEPVGMLWFRLLEFNHIFAEKGYLEASRDREEAQGLSVKIAVAVAMADGGLADVEGETIKRWIKRAVHSAPASRQERLKAVYNDAFLLAYKDALTGKLDICSLAAHLNEIGEKRVKYDTIDLCFDVMAADGVADAKEWRLISVIAEGLNLDLEEIKRLKDQKLVKLDLAATNTVNTNALLGIQAEWTPEQVRKHLREEFQKWNNRLNTLPEGEQREKAQKLLDMIADARKNVA